MTVDMYKAIVFFDLDGTLLMDDKSLSPANVQAIHELEQNNILPVVSTGRNIFEVRYVLDETGMDSIVSANGSYVQFEGKRLHAEYLEPELIEEFNAFANAQGDPVAWFNHHEFALSQETTVTDKNFKLLGLNARVEPDWYKYHHVNFMFVFNFDKEKLYQERFKGVLSLVRNNPRGLDTMLDGVSKKSGIEELLDYANFGKVPTYAFGDQLNDLEMFDLVDHPICMANGNPAVKEKAEFITTSNMNGGIVNGLRHFDLI